MCEKERDDTKIQKEMKVRKTAGRTNRSISGEINRGRDGEKKAQSHWPTSFGETTHNAHVTAHKFTKTHKLLGA